MTPILNIWGHASSWIVFVYDEHGRRVDLTGWLPSRAVAEKACERLRAEGRAR